VDKGVLEKSGTWISYAGERMGQGRENARVFLKEHKDVCVKLESALRKKMEIPGPNGSNSLPNATNGATQSDGKPAANGAASPSAVAAANKARPATAR